MSADRLFEDERATVTLTLRADGPVPLVELLEPLPASVRLDRGRHHAFFTLRAGEEIRWELGLHCTGRQRVQLGVKRVVERGDVQAQSRLSRGNADASQILFGERSVSRVARPSRKGGRVAPATRSRAMCVQFAETGNTPNGFHRQSPEFHSLRPWSVGRGPRNRHTGTAYR